MNYDLNTASFQLLSMPRTFEIALSFPGTHRRLVRKIATALSVKLDIDQVFLDDNHFGKIAGNNAVEKLREIYTNSRLVVPFFSSAYKKSPWCGFEWNVIQEVLFEKRECVVAVRIDGTAISNWPNNTIDIMKGKKGARNAEEIADRIWEVYREKCSGLVPMSKIAVAPDTSSIELDPASGATSKPNALAAPQADAMWQHRFVIIADICDSSRLSGNDLQIAIETLWGTAERVKIFRSDSGDLGNSLLDGVVLSIDRHEPAAHKSIVNLCDQWIVAWKKEVTDKKIEHGDMRIAIHEGDVCHIRRHANSHIVGPAANECSRLVRYAGHGQILLSDDFVTRWSRRSGVEVVDRLHPPIEVQIKQGVLSRFRFLKRHGISAVPSDQVTKIDMADKAIITVLTQIGDEFRGFMSLTPKQINLRVSLFAPRSTDSVLEPTDYRLVWSAKTVHFERSKERGKTEYPFGQGSPIGPLARSYLSKQVFAINDLPLYEKSPAKYRQTLLAKWGMPADFVDRMGVKARSFLTIPVFLDSDATTADAVVCLDTMQALKHLKEQDLVDIGRYLSYHSGLSLASLWMLRS